MTRRRPIVASWAMAGLTLALVIADLSTDRWFAWVIRVSAGAAFTQLCIQRHTQQAVGAALVFVAIVSIVFFPVSFTLPSTAGFGAFALLVGSRAVARLWLRRRPDPKGYPVLILGSVVFGPSASLLLNSVAYPANPSSRWRFLSSAFVAILTAALAQLLAAPWLVKTIPGAEADERPGVALWLLLMAWLAMRIAAAA